MNRRQAAFAARWSGRGTGVEAARAAGYRGTEGQLAATSSRLLTRADVREAIRARGLVPPGDEGDEDRTDEGHDDFTDPLDFHRQVMNGRALPWAVRQRAAERVEQIQRARQPDDAASERWDRLRAALLGAHPIPTDVRLRSIARAELAEPWRSRLIAFADELHAATPEER